MKKWVDAGVACVVSDFSASEALGIRVLYMSFDKFLLAVESRDLSEADKIVIRVSPFPKLIDG